MPNIRIKVEAQDAVISAIVALAALSAAEGYAERAGAIDDIAATLAKRWGAALPKGGKS